MTVPNGTRLRRYDGRPLIPRKNRFTLRERLIKLEMAARDASLHGEYAAEAWSRALDYEREGLKEDAAVQKKWGDLDHKRACAALAALAIQCRELVRSCAGDFVPCHGVEGTGLSPDFLEDLMAVFGVPLPGEEDEADEVVV